jgi:nitrogen fixation/metabolism regulation signal transduction histidine kinase
MFQNINFRYKFFLGSLPMVVFIGYVGVVNAATLIGMCMLALGSAYVTALFIRKPILMLDQAITKIINGNTNTRVPSSTQDEIGTVTRHFNQMVDTIVATQQLPDSILQSMQESLFVIGNEGTITEVNQAALNVLGYTKEELLGKSIAHVFQGELPKAKKTA